MGGCKTVFIAQKDVFLLQMYQFYSVFMFGIFFGFRV